MKSISLGGQEVLGQAIDLSQQASVQLEITIVRGAAQVQGNVPAADMINGAQVALISERPRLDGAGVFLSELDQAGHFAFTGVPPGKYCAFAFQDLDSGVWQNRAFFDELREQGVPVDVAENDRVQIQLSPLPAGELERALASISQ